MKKIIFTILFSILFVQYSSAQSLTIIEGHDLDNYCGDPLPDTVGVWLDYVFSGLNAADSVTSIIFWGDGSADSTSSPVNLLDVAGSGYESTYTGWHAYGAYGNYDLTLVVRCGSVTDTLKMPGEIVISASCAHLTVVTYNDINGNCIYDSGEPIVPANWNIYQGLSQYLPFTFSTFDTVIPVASGIYYSVQVQPVGYAFTCPVSGIINLTITGDTTLYFAMQCAAGLYDHGITHFMAGFRPQLPSSIYIQTWNNSCNIQNGTFSITLDPLLTYISANPSPVSVSGNVITWNHTGLNQNTHGGATVNVMPDPSLMIGDTVCGTSDIAVIPGDVNISNNTFSPCVPVTNSFDPNDKYVMPRGIGPLGYIAPSTDLYYMVTFQNTGNDTAYNVVVVDTLDTDLDYRTFQVLGASHNYSLKFPSDNVVQFHFDQIYLPDSNVNEAASHGFLIYKMSPRIGLLNGTSITNKAYIYFDHNAPVLTSTTLNTIQIASSLTELNASEVNVFPNPTSEEFKILMNEAWNYSVDLRDISGRQILKSGFNGKEFNCNVSNIKSGLYFGTVSNSDKKWIFQIVINQ